MAHAGCPSDRAPKTLPIARGSVVVDGVLDDPTWQAAWQQSRGGRPATTAQPLHSAIPDVVTQSAVHTLAVKLSYWWG